MRRPAPSSPLALALGVACTAALAAAPTAGAAAALKVPAPAAGDVAIAVAPLTGAAKLKVGKAGVPKGAAVTGGVVKAGAKQLALVAVIRPKTSAKIGPAIGAGRAKLGGGASSSAVLGTEPPAALTAAAAPACAGTGAAKALGHPLRRGAGAPAASDLATLGKVLAARLCGGTVDARGAALLGLLGLKTPAAKSVKPGTPRPVAGASSTASAQPTSGGSTAAPSGGGGSTTTPPPPGGGAPQCSNGKDDDGDGQIDALGSAAVFLFDPGCDTAADTTESSERTLPAQCGKGVVTQGSRVGFAVDVDGRKDAGCPKGFTKGYVDLMTKVTECDNSGWNDGHGDGWCTDELGVWAIGGKGGDAWHGNGTADQSLCGTRAVAVSYTADGSAWERDMTIADPVGACAGPVPPTNAPQCGDGIDNDFDGQIDTAGTADSGPDPGCTSASDATEAEDGYPATGCWNYVAGDPDDPTIAYIYVMPHQWDSSCPTMDSAVLSFTFLHVTACLGKPYWNGTQAGTCTVKNGDAWLSGGSGERIAVAVKVDDAIACGNYVQGQVDMRTAGLWHEAITETAQLIGDQLAECPHEY